MEEYRDLFLAEAQEYLQNMNQCLLEMEKNPTNTHLTELFRAAHSLKGMAGTMGYELITELTHEMESLLDQLRSGEAVAERDFVNLLFESVDLVQLLIDNLENQEHFSTEVRVLEQKLQGWRKKPAEALSSRDSFLPVEVQVMAEDPANEKESSFAWTDKLNEFEKEMLKEALSRGERIYHLYVRLHRGSLLKSVRAYMVLKAAEKEGEIVKTVPSLRELDEERFDRDFSCLMVGKPDVQALEETIANIAEIEKVQITMPHIDLQKEQRFLMGGVYRDDCPPEKIKQGSRLLLDNEEVADNGSRQKVKKAGGYSSAKSIERTIRVETAKLDSLVNLVGELIINRTRVLELGKKVNNEMLNDSLEQLERNTTELQNAVMTLRMVPIKQVFDRFPRMVRDLSVEKNKKVELIISGEETELDRTIVNQIGDPLVHLLRNAVDHGIEGAGTREKQGKAPVGKIFLEAHHEGSHIVVSVTDDGQGIDPQVVKEKALEKKIISKAEMEKMTAEEAMQLIFQSGLSTSREVTDISGRGVGMDVVKTAIESLNGTVEVKSELHKGTKFVLRLPLTLAIIRTLLVQSAEEIYAIPIESIRENVFVQPQEIKTIRQSKVITLREEVLPLYCLKEILGMGNFTLREVYPVVVVQAGTKKAGLIVDELIGQQEVVIKSLSSFVKDIKGIAGATVLGDGRVTLILDVAGLLEDGRC